MTANRSPEISILLPVFNAEDTLDQAISSILEQSETDFDLIIVDDGSTDGTPDIIESRSRQDSRLKPFRIDHQGIVAALNLGLEKAEGRYIARMDADDLSLPDRLEKQKAFLDEHPDIGLVSCLVEHFGDKEKKAGYARYVTWINSLTDHDSIALNRFIESPLAHPSVMFRKELVERHGGYRDGNFPEDYELWLRWLEQGARMAKIEDRLLKWRDEPDRLSRTDPRYSFEAFYRVKAKYLSRWLERNNPHHPDVVIWGAGRTTRKRAELLTGHGVEITHYVDIDPAKIGNEIHGRPVWAADDLPEPGSVFVVSYVGRHGANRMIRSELEKRGFTQGADFIFAA